MSDSRILLVEDNPLNQKIMQRFLEARGLKVDVAETGVQALTMVHSHQYALIFMDLRIPNMDGFSASLAIRKTGCTIPIIAVTAGAMDDDEKRCFDAGMN